MQKKKKKKVNHDLLLTRELESQRLKEGEVGKGIGSMHQEHKMHSNIPLIKSNKMGETGARGQNERENREVKKMRDRKILVF